MPDYADLEFSLHRREDAAQPATYTLELRFTQPLSDADTRLLEPGRPPTVTLDLPALRNREFDPEAYGQSLTGMVFADPAWRTAFAQALASAQSQQATLRVRVCPGPSAPELHGVRWELLRLPQGEGWLSTHEKVLFSRYLASGDWRPVKLLARGDLHALAVAANPANLADYQLSPVDVAGELARAQAGLGPIPCAALPDPAAPAARATLNNLLAHLRAQAGDILYLVAHGTLSKGEPWLWLEDDAGQAVRISGAELGERFRELGRLPRLVVLASCQSAGPGQGDVLAALGPRLAEAGVPAVLAMQGNISQETVAQFMPVFFGELQAHGEIDRALAVARGAVRGRPDWWMPALFMRLRSGRLWYTPGFGDQQPEFEKWKALARFIQRKKCTPILGPGLLEPYIGSTREVALRWAEAHAYPLAEHECDDLTYMAQYVATKLDPEYLLDEFGKSLHEEVIARFGPRLPEALRRSGSAAPLESLRAALEAARSPEPNEPYRLLARLRLPLYITSNPDTLLSQALAEAGAQPAVRLCPWNDEIDRARCLFPEMPSPERPLVYHLFGALDAPESLVLTEDQYFDYLIGVTRNKDLIPEAVGAALANTALLFLGFQVDAWNFRVLFRSLMTQGGSAKRKAYSHVAAQLELEEGRLRAPERARRYLEKYFEGEKISLYWGSVGDFTQALAQRLPAEGVTL